jgi:GNAT superfamily N-acetyltransferase
MPISIREAAVSDLTILYTLYQQLHTGETETTLDDIFRAFEMMRAHPGCEVFVAEQEDRVVGTFVLSVLPNMTRHGRPAAILENIVVDEAHRGRGSDGRCWNMHATWRCRVGVINCR